MDPFSALTTIAAASQRLGDWAGRALPASGPPPAFADVLRASEPPAETLAEARDRLQQLIGDALTALGIEAADPLELSVGMDGRIRLQSLHPRGAEIEAALSAREDVTSLAGQVARTAGGPVALRWPTAAPAPRLTTAVGFPYTMH